VNKQFGYVWRLLKFAFGINPALYFATALSLLSVAVELAAMTSLLPLSSLALTPGPVPHSLPVRLLMRAGLPPTFEVLLGVFVGLFALRVVTLLVSQGMVLLYGKRLHAQLSSRAFSNVVSRATLREIEERTVGYFISLAGDESFRASMIVISVVQLASVLALALLYLAAIALYSVWVVGGVLVFLAVSAIALAGAFRRSQDLGHVQTEQSRAASSVFLDALNGLRTVRAFSSEHYVIQKYTVQMFDYARTLFKVDFISLVSRITPALVLLLGLLVMVLAAPPVARSSITPGVVVTVIALLLRFFPTAGQALGSVLRVVADTKVARDVLALAGTAPLAIAAPMIERHPVTPVRSLTFRKLAFAYQAAKPVLEQFSTEFVQGRSYALMGPSGSGKSTTFDLILRFYASDGGEILLDGTSIYALGVEELRRRVLLVNQQTVIFNDTVENNIKLGYEVPLQAVERACRIARIHDVIEALPRGYQTVLSYQGSNLSGGQRQRIGIARALLREPAVLLLDEVTSGLDSTTRDQLVADVLREFRNRIVVFATHDHNIAAKVDTVVEVQMTDLIAGRPIVSSSA
jgi:ABC-type bacteriocin/lantibiotic exporter with double-glycine peptidase domain